MVSLTAALLIRWRPVGENCPQCRQSAEHRQQDRRVVNTACRTEVTGLHQGVPGYRQAESGCYDAPASVAWQDGSRARSATRPPRVYAQDGACSGCEQRRLNDDVKAAGVGRASEQEVDVHDEATEQSGAG